MRPLPALALPVLLLFLPSCLHVFIKRVEYQATAPAPSVAGAAFRAEFMPKGTQAGATLSAMVVGAAMASEVGPYQMRMHAFGKPDDQKWFEVKSLRLTSKDQFEAPMEARGFEGRAEFKPTKTPGSTRASLLIGPYIKLDAKKQRHIVLEADVAVMRRSGLSRGSIRIPLSLSKTRRHESINIIVEVAHAIRDRDKPKMPAGLPPPPETP